MINHDVQSQPDIRTRLWPDTVIRRGIAFVLDVIFPPKCALCGQIGATLCPACVARMQPIPQIDCPRCGRFLRDSTTHSSGQLCRKCRENPSSLSQARAPLCYQDPVSTIIHRFKYEGYFALAKPLSCFLIDGWPSWQRPPNLILPIPLHPRRQRQRGYNQSELLARPLGQALGIQMNATSLQRTRHTVPQVGLGPDERHENVHGAFSAVADVVGGRDVLLVDDVLTTGATMRAAAEALLAAGAASVSAYCLARVG